MRPFEFDVHPAPYAFRKSLVDCRFIYLLRKSRAFSLSGYLKGVNEAISNDRSLDFSWDQATPPLVFGRIKCWES